MTGPIVETYVDLAHFAWRRDGGLRMVSSSYLDSALVERWDQRLQNRVRMYPVPGTSMPSAGFSYLLFEDGYSAWVRRATTGVSEGRNNSLALIGPAEVLDFPAAIGLSARPGWPDEPPADGQTAPMPTSSIREAAARSDLVPFVRDYEQHVTLVLAGLLANPAAPLSVIGAEERERLVILSALHRIAEVYLPRRFQDRRSWSFSTYEDKHDTGAGKLPGVVFLPAPQPGAGTIKRIIVDLTMPRVEATDLALARQVVRSLLENRPPDERVDDMPSARRQRGRDDGAFPPVATRPAEPAPVAMATEAAPVPPARSPVAKLLAARRAGPFLRELERLESEVFRHPAGLHPHLDPAAVDRLTRFVEVDVRYELLHRVLGVLYGEGWTGGLRNVQAQEHATRLVKGARSDQLVRMVSVGARTPRIRDAAFDRWSADTGRMPTETVGQLSARWRTARRNRWFPWVTAGATVAAAGLLFLLGVVYGRPDGTVAAATPTISPQESRTTTHQSPPTSQAPAPGPVEATSQQPSVQIRPDQGRTVWIFLSTGTDRFVPLRPCQRTENSWLCSRQPGSGQQVAIDLPPGTDLSDRVNTELTRQQDWGQPQPIG